MPAFPRPRREAEDLNLDAAALQRPCQDVGACRRNRDWTAAHRSGIVEQQRNHRVPEISVLLAFERQGVQRIDNDPRQPRRIEQAFFQVEFPGTVLLRQQQSLQPVGQPGDHALQMRKLLIEVAAQTIELLRLA